MQHGKTAIGNLDRVAFCPPAGHLTSSYWAAYASHAGSRPVHGEPKFLLEAQDCRF
jgi:hypothetical protein